MITAWCSSRSSTEPRDDFRLLGPNHYGGAMQNPSTVAAARRHDLIALLGRREHTYFTYQRWCGRQGQRTLVGVGTDLCVEAPPGSGNTFFVKGFTTANPVLRLAHHHHVAAQAQRARRLSVPMLLIARDPVACVLSRAVSWTDPAAIGPTFREWISFWQNALPVVDGAVVADFAAITEEPAAVVALLNERFERSWSAAFPSRAEVFDAMDQARAVAFPSFAAEAAINPNRPDPRKDELRAWLRPQVRGHRLADRALRLYERVGAVVEPVS
jgi:hypothetical protein